MIFLSYCWENEKVADLIDNYFSENKITIRRDKRDLKYKQSIKEFMKTIRDAEYVIMIISEHYLKSKNCMYEVLEFVKNKDFEDKIIPIILKEANIFDVKEKVKYLAYWTNKKEDLKNVMKGMPPEKSIPIIQEIKEYENVESGIMDFLETITDMNNIVISGDKFSDVEFDTIKNYIKLENLVPQDTIINLSLKDDSSIEVSEIISFLNDNLINLTVVYLKDKLSSLKFESYKSPKDIENLITNRFNIDSFEELDIFLYKDAYYIAAKRKIAEYNSKVIMWWCPMWVGYTDNLKKAGYYSKREIPKIVKDQIEKDQLAIECDTVDKLSMPIIPINSDYSNSLIRDKSKIVGSLEWEDKYYF